MPIKDVSDLHARLGREKMMSAIDSNTVEVVTAVPRVRTFDTPKKRPPLTIRSIGEILGMTFDDSELVLTNGYLALGERTAICGMGGIGKSRLTMQLALCAVLATSS